MDEGPGDDTRAGEVARLLAAIEAGDRQATEQLLPLVYDELRGLARRRLAAEPPGQTLQATALVHEAYLRLVGAKAEDAQWDGRGHFFGAAAEAMRRILVERARRRGRLKHGGGRKRVSLHESAVVGDDAEVDLVALDQALRRLQEEDARKGNVVLLRYFGGLTIEETADALGISPATVKTDWTFARSWLHRELAETEAT